MLSAYDIAAATLPKIEGFVFAGFGVWSTQSRNFEFVPAEAVTLTRIDRGFNLYTASPELWFLGPSAQNTMPYTFRCSMFKFSYSDVYAYYRALTPTELLTL